MRVLLCHYIFILSCHMQWDMILLGQMNVSYVNFQICRFKNKFTGFFFPLSLRPN